MGKHHDAAKDAVNNRFPNATREQKARIVAAVVAGPRKNFELVNLDPAKMDDIARKMGVLRD